MSERSDQTRNELPTPRRLETARDKGQVAYSTDLTNGLVLLAISLLMYFLLGLFVDSLKADIASLLVRMGESVGGATDDTQWMAWLSRSAINIGLLSVPVVAVSFVITAAAGGLLTGFRFAPKAMIWDLNKINPQKGLSKLFSSRSLMRGLMAIIKLAVMVTIVAVILRLQSAKIGLSAFATFDQTVADTLELVSLISIGIAAALVVIGLVDYGYQKWKHIQELKMSRQEIQDERKEDDGDPHVRARLKKLQRELGQRRMLQDVPSATAVITNPTHYAVAIKYERSSMNAPVVVAKGADFLAAKIINVARANSVPVIERKPLARALYSSVEIGSEIPLELYQTVAEVLAYIHEMDRRQRAW